MPSYDYVIVGAGSAGCVLAHRLSEDPGVSVLLLEAGRPDAADFIHIPAAFPALYRSKDDWDLGTGYEPHLDDRRVYLPRGKILGGSSSLNAMIYIRGNPRRLRRVGRARAARAGAGTTCCRTSCAPRTTSAARARTTRVGGPLRVSDPLARTGLSEAFLDAAAALGLPASEDFNAAHQDGVRLVPGHDARRPARLHRGLLPASRRRPPEPHGARPGSHAHRVLFEGTRAVGVEGSRLGELLTSAPSARSSSAPASYLSPAPADAVRPRPPRGARAPPGAARGRVARDGARPPGPPGDGLLVGLRRPGVAQGRPRRRQPRARWAADGGGPLSSNVAECGGFLRTRDGLEAPDVQFHMVSAIFEQEGLVPPAEHGFSLSACVLKPRSRGQVAVVSPDPTTKPLIVHNYLAEPEDLRSAVDGPARPCSRCARTEPLARYAQEGHTVPASDAEEDLVAHIRHTAQTIYHPTSTCAMGPGDDAVVDLELRVRGVEGLRVVDASVMPSVVRGNTNAPTIAIAERAADLIAGRPPLGAEARGCSARAPSAPGGPRVRPRRRVAIRNSDPDARRPAPRRQREGPRDVRPRRPAAHGRQRPDLDLRRRAPDADPGQGQGAHGLSAFWFAKTGHIVANHLLSATDGVPDEARGRAHGRAQARDAARRVRRARLHHRLGLEGLPGHRHRLGHRAAARACASPSSCPTPIFTPSTKAEVGHDEAIDFDARRRARRRPRRCMGRVRDVSIALYRFAAEHARERGVILADTKFEFGLDADGELVVGDEVLTPGLLALLAGRRLRARPRPAELRQAVRARLGRRAAAGTRRRPRRRSPTTSSRARARATSRPTSASPASPSTRGWRGPAP